MSIKVFIKSPWMAGTWALNNLKNTLLKSLFILLSVASFESVFAQTCTVQQIKDFTASCKSKGDYYAGLETSCVAAGGGSHDGCGFYPLPSETRRIATGYACVVTWVISPSMRETGGTYATSTWNDAVLNCGNAPDLPSPPKNNGPSCNDCGNPINVGTGNKHQLETDYVGPGPVPLRIERTYNSGSNTFQNLGIGWRHYYQRTITPPTYVSTTVGVQNSLTMTREDGKQYLFKQVNPDPSWINEADVSGKLNNTAANDPLNLNGWKYINERNEVESFDKTGRLVQISYPSGITHNLTYSCKTTSATCPTVTPDNIARADNVLISVKDTYGREIKFFYDAYSRITKIIDPNGAVYLYQYNNNLRDANLAKVTYPDQKLRTYLYGEPSYVSATPASGIKYTNSLTGILDENNIRYATWRYDSQGRAISSEHGVGIEKVEVTYNSDGTATVKDPLNTQKTSSFVTKQSVVKSNGRSQPAVNGSPAALSSTEYDANGNVTSRLDFKGVKTTYVYDWTRNLETSRTEAVGTPQTRVITTSWHPGWRLVESRTEPLKSMFFVYNGRPDPTNGNQTLICAPATALIDGKPIAVLCKKVEQATTDTDGSQGGNPTLAAMPRIRSYTYNQYGQMLTADGPLTGDSDKTTYTYDGMGNLATITNAKGHVTSLTNYDLNGRVGRITDPNGLVTDLSYSPRGWLTAKSVVSGGTTETTTYGYDGVGQMIQVTLPDSSHISYTYDDAHRLTDISDSLGNSIYYVLDAMGNRTNEQVKDPGGTLSKQVTRIYDALNRLQQVTGAMQ